MKKWLHTAAALASVLYGTAQSHIDTLTINGNTFLLKNMSSELNVMATHTHEEQAQAHHHEQWAYYLSKPHPSINTLNSYFWQAANEYNVPVDLLRTIAQVENNWTQIGPSIDQGWGMMHLVQNSYCNTLHDAALLLNISDIQLKEDAQQNIRGAAALLRRYANDANADPQRIEDWYPYVKKFTGLIDDQLQTIQADRYYSVMNDGNRSTTLWGETVLLPKRANIDFNYINQHYKSAAAAEPANDASRSADYGPAVASMTTCNFTTGRNHSIDTYVNHWIGTGTAAGAVSWFKNCDADASAHFIVANNGTIYQSVAVANSAWHCGASGYPYNNGRSIGVEHEATVANPGLWNSTAMLQTSAQMSCYFCSQYGIATNQNHTSPGICGHQNMPGTNTSCPGTIPWSTWFGYFNTGNCSAQAPAQPANDYCGNATALTVYGATCGSSVSGDVAGATQSAAPTTCDGYASANALDVWYSFVATAASHTITVVSSSGLDAVVDLRTACPGSTIDCQDVGGGEGSTETLVATGLTAGTTYYVRVYDYSGSGTAPSTTTFTICVTTPCSTPTKPTISGTNPICSGNSTTLSVGNTCVGCTYTWSTGTTGAQITASTAGTYRVTATNSCGTISSDAYTLTVNATPQPAINNLSNTYCLAASNVTLTGTPSGGTFGGMVQSGNIFSPSNAGNGTHNVTYTVTQNGCSATVTQQVLVSSAPIVQVTTFDSTTFCTGGSATLTATQGTAYSWTNGATTQSITINQSGSYHVTVTNPGGCPNSVIVANSPVTVTVNPNPIASAGVDQNLLLVAGNSVTIGGAPTASSGTSPYTYQWLPVAGLDNSTNANPIVSNINSNTTYSLFVTDANGCADTDTVNVTTTAVCSYTVQPNYFAFAASGGIDSFYVDAVGSNCTWDVSTCPWLSITSPALPNTGSAWVYFNTSTNTTNQQRTCTITLTGGQTIVVTQQGTPQVNPCNPPLNAPTVSLNACDLAATNVPSLSYQWYLNGNLIPNANTRFHTADTTGYYYVVVADSNFCTAQSADVHVAYPACQAVGINEVVNEFIFDIYPSPANEAITVRISEPNSTLNLYDAAGRLVQSFHINNAIQNINISELANGVYYARTNNHSAIKKFIKL